MSKPDTIQVPAIFTGFSSRSDGGASLRFATNELSDVDFGALKKAHNTFGWVCFKPNEFREDEIPQDDAPTDELLTPSQRLRNALFVLWKTRGSKGEFRSFYECEMEKAIGKIKAALD